MFLSTNDHRSVKVSSLKMMTRTRMSVGNGRNSRGAEGNNEKRRRIWMKRI